MNRGDPLLISWTFKGGYPAEIIKGKERDNTHRSKQESQPIIQMEMKYST
jgi:hypothetical protein